jgi:hypothetical protein
MKTSSNPTWAPAIPQNAHPLAKENGLYQYPPDRRDPERRWFMFDYEDPSPRWKRVPADYYRKRKESYVPRGDDPTLLVSEPEDGAIRVMAEGYQYVHKPTTDDYFADGELGSNTSWCSRTFQRLVPRKLIKRSSTTSPRI